MRCTRHNRERCTVPMCVREAHDRATDGPSVDSYTSSLTSPAFTVDPYDGAMSVQVAPGAYVDVSPPPDTTPAPDPTPSYDPPPPPDPTPAPDSYSLGDF